MSDSVPAEEASGVEGGGLRAAWQGFNLWRKKRWPVRVLILLVVFAYPVYTHLTGRPVIVSLVRDVCDGIMLSSQPTIRHYRQRFYLAREARWLQQALRREFDRDEDGALSPGEAVELGQVGLPAAELEAKATEADLEALAGAAKRAGVVPEWYSAEEVRWQTWYAGRAFAEQMERRARARWEPQLKSAHRWRDYARWVTWGRGIHRFVGWLAHLSVPGETLAGLGWYPACLGLGLLAGTFVSRRRRLLGFVVAASPTVLLTLLLSLTGSPHVGPVMRPARLAGLAVLCGAVGSLGAQLAGMFRSRGWARCCAGAMTGALLIAVTAVDRLAARASWYDIRYYPRLAVGPHGSQTLLPVLAAPLLAGAAAYAAWRFVTERKRLAG